MNVRSSKVCERHTPAAPRCASRNAPAFDAAHSLYLDALIIALDAAPPALRALLPEGRPRRVARMTGKQNPKYKDIPTSAPLTLAMLADHAAGRATWACTVDAGGQSRLGVIDVDLLTPAEGRAALRAVLDAAHNLGVTAFAVNVDNQTNPDAPHCGGHIICWFDAWYCADAITHLMRQIAAAAGLPATTETWPCRQVIRLPFGYHQFAKTFGTLITQDGETATLDDEAERAAAWQLVLSLPLNSAPPALPAPALAPGARQALRLSPGEAGAARLSLTDARGRFNAEHTLDDLLTRYGAARTKDGYSCCCGVAHTHENTLYISTQGRLFSRSARCELYVKMEHHDDVTAALRALNPPPAPRQRRQEPPHSAESVEYTLTPEERARRAADAARKREARLIGAAQTIAEIESRARADDTLSDAAQLVLMALLDGVGERDWCPWSVARLQEMTGRAERSVYYALRELTKACYIANTPQRGGTTVRTFLRVQKPATPAADGTDVSTGAMMNAESGRVAPEYIREHVIHAESGACEPAPAAIPACIAVGLSTSAAPEPAPVARAQPCAALTSSCSPTHDSATEHDLRIVQAGGRYHVADEHGTRYSTHASEAAAYERIAAMYGTGDDEPHAEHTTHRRIAVALTLPSGAVARYFPTNGTSQYAARVIICHSANGYTRWTRPPTWANNTSSPPRRPQARPRRASARTLTSGMPPTCRDG